MKKTFQLFICVFITLSYLNTNAQIFYSSFESWSSGLPTDWKGKKSNITNSNILIDSSGAVSGKYCCKLTNTTSTHKRFSTQPLPVKSNTKYVISFNVKGHGEIRTAIYDGRSSASGYSSYGDYHIVNSSSWSHFTDTVVTTHDTTIGEFVFSLRNTNADLNHLNIDDVSVSIADSATQKPSPIFSIISPNNNVTISSSSVNVTFSLSNFEIGNIGDNLDGHIDYNIDNGTIMQHYSSEAIGFTELREGNHSVIITLVDNNNNTLMPSIADTVSFTVKSVTDIITETIEFKDIETLRDAEIDSTKVYKLSNNSIVTFTQSYRNQRYIQDATAAILIDDPSGVISKRWQNGDAVKNIIGKLSMLNNMLILTPTVDSAVTSRTDAIIIPKTITEQQIQDEFESYESQLVAIENVTFDINSDTVKFTSNAVYPINKSLNAVNTAFIEANYINFPIPTGEMTLVGILNSTETGNYITPRSSSDFIIVDNIKINSKQIDNTVFPNPASDIININGKDVKEITIDNIIGQNILKQRIAGNQGNTIDISSLVQGQYLIRLIGNDNTIKTLKIIKQ